MKDAASINLPNLKISHLLGRGGMASVWQARQLSLERDVAVKILSHELASDAEDVQRFVLEAQNAACLRHPGIVQVYDINAVNGIYYFVMELINGYTMGELLERKGYVEQEDLLAVAESVAVAMEYAWGNFNMVHCDIKPDNIMVDADGTVKVCDLGLSHSMSLIRMKDMPISDEIMGTPAYMSPEQIYGVDIDCRSDIYALGATLYHLITGRMLFEGLNNDDMLRAHVGTAQAPDPREIVDLEGVVVLVLERMLAKEPRYRYPHWQSLLHDFQRMRRGESPVPRLIPAGGSSIKRGVA